MLLRISITNTKKFLKKSMDNFKSYFSHKYQKLPKSPPSIPFSYETDTRRGYRKSENFYSEFIDHWEATDLVMASNPKKESSLIESNNLKIKKESSLIEASNLKVKKEPHLHEMDRIHKQEKKNIEVASSMEREERRSFVRRKLKDLEMMDKNNVDLVLDIQEVLHYYSKLTCSVYSDIIDKFFMEMYIELFNLSQQQST